MGTSKRISYREMLLSQSNDMPETADELSEESILSKIESSRRELLDLSLRNPLLNYRLLRAKGVEIVGESSTQVFDVLVVQGKAMSFLADDTKTDALSLWDEEIVLPTPPVNQSDNRLQTVESPSNLDKRLLNTFRDANTSLEETGVNTLFLALGMLQWYENDASQRVRYAPLVLVPVRLERIGARERFSIWYTGDDLGVNLSLLEKVRADFGLILPGQEELEPENEDIDAAGYISQVSDVVRQSAPDRWTVAPDSIALGFFSFNKLLMYLDLDPNNPAIAESEIIAALYRDGFREPPSAISDDAHLDSHIKPQDAYHVLDADSSQSLAIHDATGGSGRNMVIQGPPGTGKSQTITNIIGDAVGRGKRVLFVSEKMAALEVVKRRLENVGLGDACLELHSNKTNKRQTLEELKRVLEPSGQIRRDADINPADLERTRSQLNDYAEAVNTPIGQSGVSCHDAFGQLLLLADGRIDNPIHWAQLTDIHDWRGDGFHRKREVVDELRRRLERTGVPASHPFYGSRLRSLLPAAQAQLRVKIEAASQALETLADSYVSLADSLPLSHPETAADVETLLDTARLIDGAPDLGGLTLAAPQWQTHAAEIKELLDKGFQWQQVRASFDADFLPEAWDTDLRQARQVLNTTATQIEELFDKGFHCQRIRESFDADFLPEAWDSDLRQVRQVLNTTGRSFFGRLFSSSYRQARAQLASVLRGQIPKAKEVDLRIRLIDAVIEEQQMRAEINQASVQLASALRRQVPKAKEVDRTISQIIRLIDAAREEQRLRAEINGNYSHTVLALGRRWSGNNTDWDNLAPSVQWWIDHARQVSPEVVGVLQSRADGGNALPLAEVIDEVFRVLNAYRASVRELESALDMYNPARFGDANGLLSVPFAEQRRILSEWMARLPEIQDIIGFSNGVDAALQEELRPVVDVAERNPDAAESLTVWFERAWYESIVETAFSERSAIQEFDGQVHESRIERFRSIDRGSLDFNRSRVAGIHRATASRPNRLPDRLVRASNDMAEETRERQQQLRILRREIEKRSRHKPIRRLLTEAGDIIQELKPVFMMSPLSIANYLAPDSVEFDLVVFDEASQVRPVDALGSLLRGNKAVVVGDSKQMPPTSFFDRISHGEENSDEEEGVTEGIESVLDLFLSQNAPSRTLRWHYRSRHESLIAVSNREFYDNRLVVFSSPDAGREAGGLRYHYLPDAVYDTGRSRTNPVEAENVANAVMEHAARNPGLSLGVAAFSQAQAQAIEDRIETLRRQDDSCEEFFASHLEEPFFVKNLENVQGDERDVIFISVGYGRDERGLVSQNFGPLNREGGERRLNVLITRAKQQCHVFTNLHSEDITSETLGMRALRTFLAYAETGVMPDIASVSNFEVDSPFQRAVAKRLEERGYLVHQEVASGGRFVDIGIVDPKRPGRYIIGIECDGASYHSSRSARDRDRLREQVLRGLGWELHRIWSTDWFRNPERELERAVEAIENAKHHS